MHQVVSKSWHFHVTCAHADRVYLVKVIHGGEKIWLPMNGVGQDFWELGLDLPPGKYQFSYFTAEGETYFNGGSYGLKINAPNNADPRVSVRALPLPQTA